MISGQRIYAIQGKLNLIWITEKCIDRKIVGESECRRKNK